MAKAVPLTVDTLKVPQITPQAATPARAPKAGASPRPETTPEPKLRHVPLQVRIPKRRGSAFEGVLRLEAIPGNLQHMLPPRLGSAAATVQAPLAKELSDVRALGRIAAPATTHRLLAH